MAKRELLYCAANPSRSAAVGAVLMIAAGLLLGGPVSADAASPPAITSFSVTPVTDGEKGAEGNWVELSWKTEGADRVQLFRGGQEMPGRHQLPSGDVGWPLSMDGGLKTRLKKDAVFELVASNDDGQVSKTVEAGPAARRQSPTAGGPRILSFEATPRTIQSGGTVRFSWETEDAQLVRLFDGQGELESRIVLPSGKLGWPLSMNGALQETLDSSMTYKLVALSKTGRTSKSLDVIVERDEAAAEGGDCAVTVSITGKYGKFTDAVGVFRARAGDLGDFLLKSPVRTTRDHRTKGGVTSSQRSRMTVPPGEYFLVPSGGGEDGVGPFAVIYQPRRAGFTCRDGRSGRISFKADFAEY